MNSTDYTRTMTTKQYETDTIQKVIDSLNKLIFNLKFGTLEIDKIPLIIHGLTIAKDYLENDGHKFELLYSESKHD